MRIGTLRMCPDRLSRDYDTSIKNFERSNLNRQSICELYTQNTLKSRGFQRFVSCKAERARGKSLE
jgi:hypothetical protein